MAIAERRLPTAPIGFWQQFIPGVLRDGVVAARPTPGENREQAAGPTWPSMTVLTGGIPTAKDVLGDPEFVPGGGTGLVFEWLTRLAEPNPPAELIWGGLDAALRLANVQSWLLGTGKVTADDPERDLHAEQLSARDGTHPLFDEFYDWLIAHYQHVYREIDGKPCLVGTSETVGVDLELVMFASEEHVGPYEAGTPLPVHTFITRHVGDRDGEWVIAANARRMPVPGWPPAEQVLPGLLIDGN